ncbi:MAG: cytochrome c1 [Rhodospirillales bacterium]|nr:cytochrome c1 [Rhodospirillales bacterium]MBO6785605.1 cytochrome c1 [Rhodospirillales bacterium]
MTKTLTAIALGLGILAGAGNAQAAGAGVKPPSQDWSFNGIFGTYDRAALQRGFQVYRNVCANCHSLDLIAFRNLGDLGYNEDEIKAIASSYEVQDGPNEDGDMFSRPATPADRWPAPFPNSKAAAAANGGAVPPDLSLITKARGAGGDSALRVSLFHPGGFALGADYLHALLTGYKEEAPAGFSLPDGKYYNEYFPGHAISMAPPLYEGAVEYEDGTAATTEQLSSDVTMFLAWAAEPELETRKQTGIKVILFLIVLTAMLYALKRKIWSDVH